MRKRTTTLHRRGIDRRIFLAALASVGQACAPPHSTAPGTPSPSSETTQDTAAPTPGQDPTDNPTLTDTASGWETGCRNGLDDDGDQEPDCRDPDCADACTEDCADGVDQDLDALIDCLDPDCAAVCVQDCASEYDGDLDGVIGCDDPDCIDVCAEICTDGIDNDGDGNFDCHDPDCDGLCFEQCADDRDNDGDGRVDCADSDCACTYELGDGFGQVYLEMDVGEVFYATNHVAVTDMDGDGVPDIFVGRTEVLWDGSAPKSFAALGPWGSSDRTSDDAIARFDCGVDIVLIGPIGAPDLNKDGLGEIAVTCGFGGALPSVVALLQITPDVPYPTLDDALALVHYDDELDVLDPRDVVTDADGDGVDELLLSNPRFFDFRGLAVLVPGDATGDVAAEEQSIRFEGRVVGPYEQDYFGEAAAAGWDGNGDGVDDIAFTGGTDSTQDPRGWVFYGPHAGVRTTAEADIVILREPQALDGNWGSGATTVDAGDADGDGLDDLAVGQKRHSDVDFDFNFAGAAWILTAPHDAIEPLETAEVRIVSEVATELGEQVSLGGDFDGDGKSDLVASGSWLNTTGSVYVFLDPMGLGWSTSASASVVIDGPTGGDNGSSLVVTDLDGDGIPDIVVNGTQREEFDGGHALFWWAFGEDW